VKALKISNRFRIAFLLFLIKRKLEHTLKIREGLDLSTCSVTNAAIFSEILKGCYFGIRNLKFIVIGRKLQMFSQEYVIKSWEGSENISVI
jgi:hypothetical protein